MSHTSFFFFPSNVLGGAIVIIFFAMLSMLGLLSVAFRITWLYIRPAPTRLEHFFNTQFGQYAACLLIAMVFSTASGIIGISWVARRGITEDWVCRLQATFMQISNISSGYFTVAIAIHAFKSLVLKMGKSTILGRSTICTGWIMAVLIGLIPFMVHLPGGSLYGADGLSCGIRSKYPMIKFLLHLVPTFIGSLLSTLFYSLIFLVLRGTLRIQGGIELTLNPDNRQEEIHHRLLARIGASMLWYPVAYIAFSIPYLIVNLLDISGFVVPFGATVFASTCCYSLAIVNVLILYNTFRILSSVVDGSSASAGTRRIMESFPTTEHLRSPLTSWKGKISQYRSPDFPSFQLANQGLTVTSTRTCAPDSLPFHQDQSLTAPAEDETNLPSRSVGPPLTPVFDYNHIITPPPSASLYSLSEMGRRGRENSPILITGLPALHQSRFVSTLAEPHQSTYDNSIPNNEYINIRQQSTQTSSHQGSPRNRIPSWKSDALRWVYFASRKA